MANIAGSICVVYHILYDGNGVFLNFDIVGQEGKILRSADKHGNIGEKLEPSAISYILRQVQANITLPGNKKPRQWTGHSFRVGAAVDLVESGYTIEQVMRKGDWKSVQAGLRYVMAE